MKEVTIYESSQCPYCRKAKALLDKKGIKYNTIRTEFGTPEIQALMDRTKMRTVPQIFIGDTLIGGFDDLKALSDNGKLDDMLK
jgi:glutaredoxin 3